MIGQLLDIANTSRSGGGLVPLASASIYHASHIFGCLLREFAVDLRQ